MCVCVCVCVCARTACACVRACVRDVFAMYENNILPRLIMIIIKIIIVYFIQIRHTDDFPSTGIRLVSINFTAQNAHFGAVTGIETMARSSTDISMFGVEEGQGLEVLTTL